MDQGSYMEKVLLSLGLILLFSSSSIKYINKLNHLTDLFFYLGGILIVTVAMKSLVKQDIVMKNTFKTMTFLYGSFIGLVIVSTFVNQSLEIEIGALEKFSMIFLFLGICLTLTDVLSEKLILNSVIISTSIIFIYFFIDYPLPDITVEAYKGGFNNPNRLGMLAVTLFSASIVAGVSLLKSQQRYILALIYLLIAIGAGYLTIISNSRTSFIALVVVFAIVTLTYIYEVLKMYNKLSWKSIFITILLAIGGLSLFVLIDNPAYAVLESTVLDKFTSKIESGRLTAGRAEGWQGIIQDTNMFGTVSYFESHNWVHAHNSFLEIIVYYGWFTGAAYLLFWLAMLIKSVHYYIMEKLINAYAILPLAVIMNFLLLSTMELVEFHIATFLAISMIGIFSKPKERSWKA